MPAKRPSFRKGRGNSNGGSPEELFYGLQRDKSHGYLRGPQQDVLRKYVAIGPNETDLAFELPTGTGKTTVGLVVAEWRRRKTNGRVAYLTLTNQLAQQVLLEGKKLGIRCADLRGTRIERDPIEEGLYLSAEAVGVTTFANLFNARPAVSDPDTLIMDDAHGGESFVADMWTTRLSASRDAVAYQAALAGLRPALTDTQFRAITDETSFPTVELCDIRRAEECLSALTDVLDALDEPRISFPWRRTRPNLHACLILVSRNSIAIRPLVPPTNTHAHFADAAQRVYMSATLGGAGDLQRSYGLTNISVIGAEQPQWGRRYVFVPELVMESEKAIELAAGLWDSMRLRRAVLLAPSGYIADRYFDGFKSAAGAKPTRMTAEDISDSLQPFVKSEAAMLTLANRYDGLDLPDDDCRLLIMAESPVAVGELEQHLRDRWKLGPLLRRRERTRLVQGMGRCTRNATDFAVIVWLGQSLVNSSTNRTLIGGMPDALRAEIAWGRTQGQIGAEDKEQLREMMLGLLEDPEYRKDADESIDDVDIDAPFQEPELYDECARAEVKFARALWSGNLSAAYEEARSALDSLGHASLTGYRAWWWYLASVVAYQLHDRSKEIDCLLRGVACGVNAGRFDEMLRARDAVASSDARDSINTATENLWDRLDTLGWIGMKFGKFVDDMLADIRRPDDHTRFHQGLESLGALLGAVVQRPRGQGVPDVVWVFNGRTAIAFEAKSEKKSDGRLSKRDVQQAKGHVDWVRNALSDGASLTDVIPVIVASTSRLDEAALPHAEGVYHITPDLVGTISEKAKNTVTKLRAKYSGSEFSEKGREFATDLGIADLDVDSIKAIFLNAPLLPVVRP